MAMLEEIGWPGVTDVARKIFQGARTVPPEQFQNWVFQQIRPVIYFDSAIWASGVNLDGKLLFHSIHLYNQPPKLLENYAHYAQEDILCRLVVESPGKTVCPEDMMPREEIESLDIYRYHCKPFGLEHAISTICVDADNNILAGASLYRKEIDNPFSESDKAAKQLLTPMLIEARNLNTFLHLNKPNCFGNCASAICDIKGILRDAESGFSELVCREWPNWKGPLLPVVPEPMMNGGSKAVFNGERIVLRLQPWNELLKITAREKSAFDSLTRSEQQIAQRLTEGLTNKEIANAIGVSPKTVGNHLHHIFAKLGVPNRQRAIAMLKDGALNQGQ